jgi:serine/threonine-protein kinase HipA
MNTAYINLWNKRVGAVLWDEERRFASFEYDQSFSRHGWDIAPIQMPIEQIGQIFSFPELAGNMTFT